MFRPTITDYIGAFDNPVGVFRTLGDVAIDRDVYGAPLIHVGNSAAIFTCSVSGGGRRFLKCYIRPNPYLRDIYDYIAREQHPLLPRVGLLREELFVHTFGGESGWVDVVEGEWIEGETLAAAVARAARNDDFECFGRLAGAFDDLCELLAAAEWAHGDLKPENIIVGAEGLSLIDCDAMWIPALKGFPAVEFGSPPWCDPARATTKVFDRSIDIRPARLISQALHTLATNPVVRHNCKTLEEVLEFKKF
jgi:serine/threonine protein kinase